MRQGLLGTAFAQMSCFCVFQNNQQPAWLKDTYNKAFHIEIRPLMHQAEAQCIRNQPGAQLDLALGPRDTVPATTSKQHGQFKGPFVVTHATDMCLSSTRAALSLPDQLGHELVTPGLAAALCLTDDCWHFPQLQQLQDQDQPSSKLSPHTSAAISAARRHLIGTVSNSNVLRFTPVP